MAHVDVPKDLNGIRTTFAFGMSGKQLIMLLSGAVMALGLTALLRSAFDMTLFTSFIIGAMVTLAPISFCAFYRKNGMDFGKVARIVLRHKVRNKQIRLYKTNNFYFQMANSFTGSSNTNFKPSVGKEDYFDRKTGNKETTTTRQSNKQTTAKTNGKR